VKATLQLGELMATDKRSLDPRNFPDDAFDLYSIPAFDAGAPVHMLGREIGSSKQIVQANDVLLSRIVPHIRRAWIVPPDAGPRSVGSSEWIIFRSERFHAPYLRQLLISDRFHTAFMRTVAGVGGSLLRARPAYVSKIEVPFPRLDEQRRIASLLDRADAVRMKRKGSLELLDSLATAIFLDMFGDPLTNERGWDSTDKLGDVAEVVSGITKGRKMGNEPTRSVPYLAVANVQAGHLRLDYIKSIDATEAEIHRYRLRAGDLVLTEGGDPDKLGRGTLWMNEIDECIHQNHIFRVRLVDPGFVPLFLSRLLSSERGRRYFLRSAKQTTGIASINATQLRNFPLLRPPFALQSEFVRRIDARARLVGKATQSSAELGALSAVLQHEAFSGAL
jgi:type I restriction enzyme S subunit